MTRKTLPGIGSALLLAIAGLLATTSPAQADDEPVLHHVKYTLMAAKPIYANIYYLDQEPPHYADYSHNPYQFVPNIQADVKPESPWTYELDLENPYEWAFFLANVGGEPSAPMFRCQLMVDGGIVATQDGPKGVLCSMRPR
jgi:hypothetical protein